MFNEIDGPAELARIAARYIVSGGRAIGIKVIHSSFSQRPVHQGSDSTVRIDKSQPRGGVVENKRAGIEERDDYKTAEEMQVRIDGPDIHEELLFSSLGCSVRISTWSTNSRALAGSPIETIRLRGEIVGRSYVGAIPPNPGFLYENAAAVEVLMGFGSEWTPTYRDSLFLADAIRHLAGAAFNAGHAPILFLQTPVAHPPTYSAGDGSRETYRSSVSNTIRMAVGISKDRPHARIDFISAVEKFANEWGLSLYVSDPRPGRVRGEWFELSQGNMEKFRRRRDDHFDGVTHDPVSRVVLLTVVGPARPGSSLAIASKLLEQGVGVNAASISALSEIAMINLLVPVGQSVPDAFSNSAGGGVNSAERGIRQLRGLCGLINAVGDEELANIDTSLLSGYQMLRSEVFDVRAYSSGPSCYPLWVAWDLPSPIVDLNSISTLLLECLEQHVEAAEVAYARARLTPEGHMRGRSKISVQLKPEARLRITISLRSIAESLEEDATAALSETFGSPIDVGLRVTSRERWLGRWNLPV